MSQIKQGDLVTINSAGPNSLNVYQVAGKMADSSFLNHPLAPHCYLLKADDALNKVVANVKSPTQRCLEFLNKNGNHLNHSRRADVQALCLAFVVNQRLSPKQNKELSYICGEIAVVKLDNNFSLASRMVVDNRGLLDEELSTFFRVFEAKGIFAGKQTPSPRERVAIFNQAGFVLAQLESTVVAQPQGGMNESGS